MPLETCDTCRFCRPVAVGTRLVCCFAPPAPATSGATTVGLTLWPPVNRTDWCGEWSAKGTPASGLANVYGWPLTFSFSATTTAPPTGSQIRFNAATYADVTKVWMRTLTVEGFDQYYMLTRLLPGGTLVVQDKGDHLLAVKFSILAAPLDKGTYVELSVALVESAGLLAAQQVLVVFLAPVGPG